MPVLAPRRVPPCLTASVAASKTRMNETGPLAAPCVVRTRSPLGRMREKENPVPPPLLCISAMLLTASKTDGKLRGVAACIHQRRRVWQEFQSLHHVVKGFGDFLDTVGGVISEFSR